MLQLRAHSITQYQMKEARVCIDATIPLLSHSGLHIYGGDLNTKHLSDGDPSLGRPAESLGRISCPPPPHTQHTHTAVIHSEESPWSGQTRNPPQELQNIEPETERGRERGRETIHLSPPTRPVSAGVVKVTSLRRAWIGL